MILTLFWALNKINSIFYSSKYFIFPETLAHKTIYIYVLKNLKRKLKKLDYFDL